MQTVKIENAYEFALARLRAGKPLAYCIRRGANERKAHREIVRAQLQHFRESCGGE